MMNVTIFKNKITFFLLTMLLGLSFCLINCNSAVKDDGHDHSGHNHAAGAEHAHTEGDGHDHGNESEAGHGHGTATSGTEQVIHVKPEIIKRWGIEYENPTIRDYVEKTTLTGVVKENKDSTYIINAMVGGLVSALKKDVGQRVQKGDILCVLNSPELLELKTNFMKSFQEHRQTKENFQRTQKLFSIKAIEKKELMNRETAYKNAMAEYFSLEAQLSAIGFSKSQLTNIKDAIVEDKTDQLKDFLSPYYYIPAPSAGKVVFRDLNLGQRVENDKAIFTITDTGKLWAILDALEKDLAYVEYGKEISIETDAYPGKVFQGKILTVLERIDPELRTVKVRAEVINPDGLLKPEMYVKGRVRKALPKKFPAVPVEALVKISGVDGVFVIDGDGFKFNPIQVKDTDSDGFAFVNGLTAEDMVITKGSFYLKAEYEIQAGGGTDPHAGHQH